ncbi:MAG: methylated-DNA--[protein]-cysteine S-methyltransferase [Candidatus Cloacimonetes bacterium]|nr:methylated-DNA--[protein]-cysteine S-methyltransferase [Candidatus Cloacimonadota bacterium]
MKSRYLMGVLSSESEEEICKILILMTEANLIEKISLIPLSEESIDLSEEKRISFDVADNQAEKKIYLNKDISPIPQNLKESIINRFLNTEIKITHISFFRTDFVKKVFERLNLINYGQTITYRELAEKIGNAKSARAVGNALRNNPLPLIYPCHRVVGVNGLGGFSGNHVEYIKIKSKLLEIEKKREKITIN